jgi:hypothetical protein
VSLPCHFVRLLFNCVASIVFVHGLKGDCQKTWTDKSSGNPWPKTLLPLEIETARVLTYSYDSTVTGKEDGPSQNRISNHAYNLVTALASLRQSDNTVNIPIPNFILD